MRCDAFHPAHGDGDILNPASDMSRVEFAVRYDGHGVWREPSRAGFFRGVFRWLMALMWAA